jgi:hypothetical protein
MLSSWIQYQREGMGEAGTNYWDLGPDYVAYVFVFMGSIIICWLTNQPFQAKPQFTLQLTVSLSNLV